MPVSKWQRFIEEATRRLKAFDCKADINAFGYVGDGNIHFNILQPRHASKEAFLARKSEYEAIVYASVRAFDGSISAEHGIGKSKVGTLMANKSTLELELMRRIRGVLAEGAFNPDKVIPVR